MKNTLKRTGSNKLNLRKITIARLNDTEIEMVKGGLSLDLEDGKISITTLNGGGTFQTGYMGSNCQDIQTKPPATKPNKLFDDIVAP